MTADPTVQYYHEYFVAEGFFDPESRRYLEPSIFIQTLWSTFRFTLTVMFFCLLLGYPIAYFLAMHIHSFKWQMALFLVCMVPFWTSYLIRAVAWLPMLGRRGLLNRASCSIMGIIDKPVDVPAVFAVQLHDGVGAALRRAVRRTHLFLAGENSTRTILEAARDMGAQTRSRFSARSSARSHSRGWPSE